jgi:lysozyme
MGVNGVLKFKKMWEALKRADYMEASKQMMDSTWAVQTPNRAKKLSEMMRAAV